MRATKYKTFLKLSAAIFLLSTFIVSNLAPLSASAAVVAPTLPISWVENGHTTAVDAGGNEYKSVGYACVVGAISVTNSAGTAIDSSNAGTNGTVKVNVVTETGNGTPTKVPGCANSTVAEYVWVSTNTSTHYALIVYSPNLSSTVKTQLDPKQCPINTNTGCNAVVWVLSAGGALDTGSGIGNPAGTGNFLKVTTMVVNPAVVSQAITPTTPASAAGSDLSCPNNGFSWIICPVISMAVDAANVFDGQITCLMQIDLTDVFGTGSNAGNPYATACGTSSDTATITKTSNAYYHAWNTFRSLALALIVIAGLVMIISQAAGAELLDAYAIRKILPRLLIAGVAITLSWQIMEFLIQITNAVGYGVRDIIYYPFNNFGGLTISGIGSTLVGLLVGGGAILALGAPGLLLLALTAILGAIVAFITLILRKLVIIFLLMLAPLAIACYILPNTQKVWKMWWDTLSKALMMFPIIAAMIAVGHVFAATSYGSGGGGVISQSIALLAYFLPYFMIPTAVRMAGGAVGSIGGMISKASQGGFTALKKGRAGIREKNMHAIKSGTRWQGNAVGEKLSRGLQNASLLSKSGLNPRQMRGRMDAARSTMTSARSAEGEKSAAVQSIKNNDDLLMASLAGNRTDADARSYLENKGQTGRLLEQNVASIRQAKRDMGTVAFEDFAASSLPATGTFAVEGGAAEMFETINRVAGSDRARASRILGVARANADRARRPDLSGAGFGTSIGQMEALYSGTTTAAAVNEVITDNALESKSAGEIASARNNGFLNMQGAILRRQTKADAAVALAEASGDGAAIERAKHEQKRVLAHTSTLLDIAGQLSPENATVVGAIMGQETGKMIDDESSGNYEIRQKVDLDGNLAVDKSTNLPVMERVMKKRGTKKETWGDRIESTEGDAEYKQYKKTYSSDRLASQAAAAAAAASGGTPGSIPGGTGPGGT